MTRRTRQHNCTDGRVLTAHIPASPTHSASHWLPRSVAMGGYLSMTESAAVEAAIVSDVPPVCAVLCVTSLGCGGLTRLCAILTCRLSRALTCHHGTRRAAFPVPFPGVDLASAEQ